MEYIKTINKVLDQQIYYFTNYILHNYQTSRCLAAAPKLGIDRCDEQNNITDIWILRYEEYVTPECQSKIK